jgi:hypothetical protein
LKKLRYGRKEAFKAHSRDVNQKIISSSHVSPFSETRYERA